jgi:hypothetical protein
MALSRQGQRFLIVLIAAFGFSSEVSLAQKSGLATKFTDMRESSEAPTSQVRLPLRKLFIFPGSDDMGNTIAPELDRALAKKLRSNSRFELIENPKISLALRQDEKNYQRVAQNAEVHAKTLRMVAADSSIYIEAKHVGEQLRLKMEWRRQDGTLLFNETQNAPAKAALADQAQVIEAMTDAVISRIPFRGTVTGRTGETITIDLNDQQVSVGDKLNISRIVSTKEHPLFKTLINIDYVAVGTAEITSVDRVLAFAKITRESSGEEISVDNKITQVEVLGGINNARAKRPAIPRDAVKDQDWTRLDKKEKSVADPLDETEKLSGEFEKTKARYGVLGARLLAGNLSHDESANGVNTELSAFAMGAGFLGEAWITKNWLVGLTYDFMSAELKGKRAGATISAPGTSWSKLDFYAGYRYLTEDSLEGTFITFGLGYESEKMNLPFDNNNQLGKKSYSGLLLLLMADVVLDKAGRIEVGLGIQPFSSLSETEFTSGTTDGASVVNASARWNYEWIRNLYFNAGIEYSIANGSFKGGKTMTEKRFAISPGLKYLF